MVGCSEKSALSTPCLQTAFRSRAMQTAGSPGLSDLTEFANVANYTCTRRRVNIAFFHAISLQRMTYGASPWPARGFLQGSLRGSHCGAEADASRAPWPAKNDDPCGDQPSAVAALILIRPLPWAVGRSRLGCDAWRVAGDYRRPSRYTITSARSAGVMPLIRPAWPRLVGWTRMSFSRASARS